MDIAKRIAELPPEKRDALLRQLKARQRDAAPEASSAAPPVEEVPTDGASFPLTDIQQVYWIGRSGLFELSACGSNVYTEYEIILEHPAAVGPFIARFNQALALVVARHDILRMVVQPDGSQHILETTPPYQMPLIDLRGQPAEAVAAATAAAQERMSSANAAVLRWPLFDFLAHWYDDCRLMIYIRIDALLTDGTSRKILLLDLFRYLADPQAQLPPLDYSYRAYALEWARQQTSEPHRRAQAYWLARLPSLPPAPELPRALPLRQETPSRFVARARQLLDMQHWEHLKAHASRLGLTPSGVVIAAYAEVVAIWSRSPHFTLSLVGSYRPPLHPDIVNVVGNFNTFHILEVAPVAGSFAERAQQLQRRMTEDLDHLAFSGPQVLRALNRWHHSGARASAPIMFNSLIEYNHPSYYRPLANGLPSIGGSSTYEEIDLALLIPQVLLMPNVLEMEDGSIYGKWYAVDAVFPAGLMEEMFEAYIRLLRCLAVDAASWEEHRQQTITRLLARPAAPPTTAPAPATLDGLFRAQVARQPSQAALVDRTTRLSYAELERLSAQVAQGLRAAGVGRGAVVGLALAASWRQLVALLGVLRAGAVGLPLSDAPAAPSQPRTHALVDSPAPPQADWPTHLLTLDSLLGDEATAESLAPLAQPDDLGFLLPSNTATGQLAQLTHRAAASALSALMQRAGIGPGERLLIHAPQGTSQALYTAIGALAAGATLIGPSSAGRDIQAVLDQLRHERVTVWAAPAALLAQLGQRLADLPDLRLALILPDQPAQIDLGQLQAPGLQLLAIGGPAEAGGYVWSGGSGPLIDAPLDGQRLEVLNDALEPRPCWVPGLLHIAGPSLAQGYWGDPAASQAAFISHPHSNERMYCTGIVARRLPTGQLELLGPAAELIGGPGYLIGPAQLAAALGRQPGVQQALVRVAPQRGVTAYVVAEAPDLAQLRAALAALLPEPGPPLAIGQLPALPLTDTGALDLSALPALEPPVAPDQQPADPALEQQLIQIWEALLKTQPIAANDDFFALGGTSLIMAQLLVRLRADYGIQPLPASYWHQPTVRQLAALVREQLRPGAEAAPQH